MSMYDITLTPNAIGSGFKPFFLEEPAWQRAVSLVESTGYCGNTFGGLDRTTTRYFVQGLRQVLQQGKAKAEDRSVLAALVTFLEGPGSGGTALSRNYRRLNSPSC